VLALRARLGVALALLALAAFAAYVAEPPSATAKKPSAEATQPEAETAPGDDAGPARDSSGRRPKRAKRPRKPREPKPPREPQEPEPVPGGGHPPGQGPKDPGGRPGDDDPPAATPSANAPTARPRKPSGNGLQRSKGSLLRPVVTLRPATGGGRARAPRPRPRRSGRPADGGVRGDSAAGRSSGGHFEAVPEAGSGRAPLAPAAVADPGASGQRDADESGSAVGTPLSRTVRDIVEVVPKPLKLAIAALAALSMMLAAGSIFSTLRARRLDRQRAELLREVGLLQAALLPPVPETVGALITSVAYRPAEGLAAGGDFYDALMLPGGRAAFILGDVSGHGRQALARTAFMRYTLRAYLEAGLEPRVALQVAGRVIEGNLDGDFATVVLAVHDPVRGSLTYACAGHPAPIVITPDPFEPVLAASSPPIGVGLKTGLRQTTVPLPPGSAACFFTDGLAEARTESGVLGRPRLGDLVQELEPERGGAQELLDRVAAEARATPDDMAAVLVRPAADVTAGGFRTEQLELDADDLEAGLPLRFLTACGVGPDEMLAGAHDAEVAVREFGGAVLHVVFGTSGQHVDVLPRNVESLQAASLRAAAAV
jgi:serine phosphatase RsbU (regulator of sigma subunit)